MGRISARSWLSRTKRDADEWQRLLIGLEIGRRRASLDGDFRVKTDRCYDG